MKQRRQGFVMGVVTTLMIMSLCVTAFAASQTISVNGGVKIKLDGKAFTPTDVNGKVVDVFEYNGTTYVPVRAISQAFNKEVGWDGTTRTVIIGENGTSTQQTGSTKGSVIYDKDGIKITFMGFEKPPAPLLGYYINLKIENTSDIDYTIQTEDVSANDIMVPFGYYAFSCDVAAGKQANDRIWLLNLEQNGITEPITKAEFKLKLFAGGLNGERQVSDIISVR